jgi:hypothetical protein
MAGPRPLKEEELRYLRILALRIGVPCTLGYDTKILSFLTKRGLVEEVPVNSRSAVQITDKGLMEVAKSGRFTLYDPALLLKRYFYLHPRLKSKLNPMSLRVIGLQDYLNPEKPWEVVRNLTYLQMDQDLWRQSCGSQPMMILGNVLRWYESELSGESELATIRYDEVVAELNKELGRERRQGERVHRRQGHGREDSRRRHGR